MGAELAAVLFDMDGTLLDSEKVWTVALEDLVRWLGGALSESAREGMIGSSLERSIAIVHEDLGIDADPRASGAFLTERTAELFRTELEWRAGAPELLEAVRRAGIPSVLVTSTSRELTEIALDFIGRERFVATVCGDEVARPKPAPDPYLAAAARVPADARACVAVEDSVLGLSSALAAGCAVLVAPCEVPIAPGPGYAVVDSLAGVGVADLAALLPGA
ncbi:MAG: HAD family phosphatase [Actinomycetia bacterium]|nr:HAD family phosphatase [Actinomycetes bacterium]